MFVSFDVLSEATLCDVYVVLCHVLSQNHFNCTKKVLVFTKWKNKISIHRTFKENFFLLLLIEKYNKLQFRNVSFSRIFFLLSFKGFIVPDELGFLNALGKYEEKDVVLQLPGELFL
jgi:hypothetical protein